MDTHDDGRCWRETAPEDGPPLIDNGTFTFQAHHVGWIVCGFFALTSTITSWWLIDKHLQWYTNKREQRYIVRLLFMVPIYALISFASYLFWNHSTALLLVRDGYESFVLTAFFYLLLMYISPDPEEQRRIFLKKGISKQEYREAVRKGEKPRRWVFPLGWFNWRPENGMNFLQIQKWGVLQYTVVRPATTLAAVILDYMGLYCETSWGLGWGHVYIVIVVSISVTIAMYCLIQLYVVVSKELAPHKPLLKLFSVKAVVFLTFWQATLLSMLSLFGFVNDTKYMTAEDINIGFGALLECFEMMFFAFLHLKAFSYKPYRPTLESKIAIERTPRWRSLCHSLDFRETFGEIWLGTKYMWSLSRGRQPAVDTRAMRVSHYSEAFERARPSHIDKRFPSVEKKEQKSSIDGGHAKPTLPNIDIQVDHTTETNISGERQWLGVGDDYGYGIGYLRREKSETLEVQIQNELARRGYEEEIPGRGHIGRAPEEQATMGHTRARRSWWRSLYDRISSSGADEDHETLLPPSSKKNSSHNQHLQRSSPKDPIMPSGHLLSEYDQNFNESPPAGFLRPYATRFSSGRVISGQNDLPPSGSGAELDMLAPLSVFNERRGSSHQRGAPRKVSRPTPRASGLPASTSAGGVGTPNMPSSSPSIQRSDSLLGRIFPTTMSTESSTEHGHSSDAASTHRLSKKPFRASLIPGVPAVVPLDHDLSMAGERPIVHSTVHGDLFGKPLPPSVAEIAQVNPAVPSTGYEHLPSPGMAPPRILNASIPVSSSSSPPHRVSSPQSHSPPSPIHAQAERLAKPRRNSQDSSLKRAPARVYSRDSRRQSVPTPIGQHRDLNVYSPEFHRHNANNAYTPRQDSGSRRYSTPVPLLSSPSHVPPVRHLATHQEHGSQDTSSDITQPSYSGTLVANKFPSPASQPMHISPEDASRYPSFTGLPQRPQPFIQPTNAPSSVPSFSNVHMQPPPPAPPAIQEPHKSRPYTNRNDVYSPFHPPL